MWRKATTDSYPYSLNTPRLRFFSYSRPLYSKQHNGKEIKQQTLLKALIVKALPHPKTNKNQAKHKRFYFTYATSKPKTEQIILI